DPRLDIARHLLGGMISDVIDHLAITNRQPPPRESPASDGATAKRPAQRPSPRAPTRGRTEPSLATSAHPDYERDTRAAPPTPFTARPVETHPMPGPSNVFASSQERREKLMRELIEIDQERRDMRAAQLKRSFEEDIL